MKITKMGKNSNKIKGAAAIGLTFVMAAAVAGCTQDEEIVDTTTTTGIVETTEAPSYTYLDEEETNYVDPDLQEDELVLFFEQIKAETAKYGDVEVFDEGMEYGIKINSVSNYSKLSEAINRFDSHYNISTLSCDVAIFEKMDLDLKGIESISLYSYNGTYISNVDLSKYKTLESVALTNAGVARLSKGISHLDIRGTERLDGNSLNVDEEIGSLYATYGKVYYPGDPEIRAYEEAGRRLEYDIDINISNVDLTNTYLWVSHETTKLTLNNCVLNNTINPCCDSLTINCADCDGVMTMDENTIIRNSLTINDTNNVELPSNEFCFEEKTVITRNGRNITDSLDARFR